MTLSLSRSGFTLVELAIVLMIIGLLIGGILKGQEMIINARIVSTMRQIKGYDAGIISFQDAYGYLPGDIPNPSVRLPNCSAAQCNIGGNANGIIGTNNILGDENNTFWLHLAAAGLISGIDMNGTWPPGDFREFPLPMIPLHDNSMYVIHANYAPSAGWPEGFHGHTYYVTGLDASRAIVNTLPVSIVQRMDTKFDNGKPCTGKIVGINSCTAAVAAANTYDAIDLSTLCRILISVGI